MSSGGSGCVLHFAAEDADGEDHDASRCINPASQGAVALGVVVWRLGLGSLDVLRDSEAR